MINLATIMEATKVLIQNNANFSGYTIVRGEYINTDPSIDKWVGIYKAKVKYTPWVIGKGARNWKAEVELKIVTQAFGIRGDLVDEELDTKITNLLAAIETDRTLGGTVSMITGYDISYEYERNDDSTIPFQNAMISLLGETRA